MLWHNQCNCIIVGKHNRLDMSFEKFLKEDYLMGLFGGFGNGTNEGCCDLLLILFLLNSCGCGCNINLDCNTIIMLLLFSTICGPERGMGGHPCH